MSGGQITSLAEAAQARVDAVAEVAAAEAALAAVKPEYDAARDRLNAARKRVTQLDDGMAGVKQAYAINVALAEAGVEFEGPPIVMSEVYAGMRPYFLVAVGPKGTGLYLYTPKRSHRYEGKTHVVRAEDAAKHGVTEQPYEGHHYERPNTGMIEAGLYAWQARGKGDFGMNGAFKPLAPPEGGRWKWLKVREQESLSEESS